MKTEKRKNNNIIICFWLFFIAFAILYAGYFIDKDLRDINKTLQSNERLK